MVKGRAGLKGPAWERGRRRWRNRKIGKEVGKGREKVGDLDGGGSEGGKESVSGKGGRNTDPKTASGGGKLGDAPAEIGERVEAKTVGGATEGKVELQQGT